jgi:hypothetical protein
MTVQILLTNRLSCTLVIIGQLLWDPSATHFPTPEVIMDNTIHRAVIHVEFYGNFINSDSSVVTDSLLDLLFHCLGCHANWSPTVVFITDVLSSILKSFHPYTLPWLKQLSPYWTFILLWLQKVSHPLTTIKTNKASLLFQGASWQCSGHVVRAIAQAHNAQSSQPLYGILLRSHFVSRNTIFRCAYFSMHFRIKLLLFHDFFRIINDVITQPANLHLQEDMLTKIN